MRIEGSPGKSFWKKGDNNTNVLINIKFYKPFLLFIL